MASRSLSTPSGENPCAPAGNPPNSVLARRRRLWQSWTMRPSFPRPAHLLPLLLAAVLVLAVASPAHAHKAGMRLSIGPVVGTTSPIRVTRVGVMVVRPFGGGKLALELRDLRTAAGAKLEAPGNTLRLALRVNGTPTQVDLPFDVHKGKATLRSSITPAQPLYKGDLVELVGLDLLDANGARFGGIGVPPGTRDPIVSSSLIYVVDSTSQVRFSRGGDARLKLRDAGNFNSGFDTLLDPDGKEISHPGVTVRLDLLRNGAAAPFSYSYDIVRGRSVPNGRPVVEIGLAMTETVEVRALDVYDNMNVRFATLGIRIAAPKRP